MTDHHEEPGPSPVSSIERSRDPVATLVRAARAGDEASFRQLVERVYGTIHRWALVRIGHPDDADEVTQRVLIRLHRHLDRWEGRGGFETWLYRITANAASSLCREQARASASELRVTPDEPRGARLEASVAPPEAVAPGPLDRVWLGQLTALVRDFFEELPPRQREVFDLADLQGYAPAEIAEMLNMNASTVRANLFKARRAIRLRVLERHPELAEGYGR